MEKHLIKFDDYKFRCSGFGSIMTEPKVKSPKIQIAELELQKKLTVSSYSSKIQEAERKRDEIKNKETKGWEKADQKVNDLNQEYELKIIDINSTIQSLLPSINEIYLSETCKKYLIKIYVEAKYGRRDDLINRYVKKGTEVEGNSIGILNEVDDVFPFYEKNTIRRFDEYKQGECDIYHIGSDVKKVLDTKSSWDLITFNNKTIEGVDSDYWWQGQGYMDLWDVDIFELAYVLTNTPEGIIEDECKRLLYAMGTNKKDTVIYKEGCSAIEYNLKYDDIPIQERVFKHVIKRDNEAITRVHNRIQECRIWLNLHAKNEFIRVYGLTEYEKLNVEEKNQEKVNNEEKRIEVVVPVTVPIDINIPKLDITLKSSVKVVDMNDGDLAKVAKDTAEIINEAVGESVIVTAAPEPVIVETYEPIVEPDFNLIYSTIESITNKEDLDKYFIEIEDIAREHEGVREAFVDKVTELSSVKNQSIQLAAKPDDIQITLSIKYDDQPVSFESTNEPVEADPEYQKLRNQIENCKDKEEVIELRKEIKHNFEKYPDLSDIITQKRDSFIVSTEPTEVKETKKVVLNIPAAQTEIKASVGYEPSASGSVDDEKIKRIYESVKNMKSKEEIQALYRENKDVIDKNLPLRRFMETSIDKLKNIPS